MKSILFFFFFFRLFTVAAQTDDEAQRKFMDTLNMGGTYLVGKTLPIFDLKSVKGKLYTDKNLIDKITFINFWFEACAPCIAEMNALEMLYENFKEYKNFQFLSVTYEKKETIERIMGKYKMTYPVLSTSADSCYYLNYRKGFPTTIIIDEKGKIVFFTFGGGTNPIAVELYFKTNLYPLLNCLLKCK